MNDKIELLKKMQESELSIIKGQHERALKRLKDQQSNELASLAKKHENAIIMMKLIEIDESLSRVYER